LLSYLGRCGILIIQPLYVCRKRKRLHFSSRAQRLIEKCGKERRKQTVGS
jgi:hypothetical protein